MHTNQARNYHTVDVQCADLADHLRWLTATNSCTMSFKML